MDRIFTYSSLEIFTENGLDIESQRNCVNVWLDNDENIL